VRLSVGQAAAILGLSLSLYTLYYNCFGEPPKPEETALFVIGSALATVLIGRIVKRARTPGSSQ
jgi:hypothetical protein